eukprot:4656761-Pyramimonas_sp.AAC.1
MQRRKARHRRRMRRESRSEPSLTPKTPMATASRFAPLIDDELPPTHPTPTVTMPAALTAPRGRPNMRAPPPPTSTNRSIERPWGSTLVMRRTDQQGGGRNAGAMTIGASRHGDGQTDAQNDVAQSHKETQPAMLPFRQPPKRLGVAGMSATTHATKHDDAAQEHRHARHKKSAAMHPL